MWKLYLTDELMGQSYDKLCGQKSVVHYVYYLMLDNYHGLVKYLNRWRNDGINLDYESHINVNAFVPRSTIKYTRF